MLLSIIVPVYNTEKYLAKCIDSILNQTYEDFELILVDDGSKDNSGDICDSYAQKDSRIRVLHIERSGVIHARKTGVTEAVGEYVTFVDADDWIDDNMYEAMLSGSAADVVICEMVRETAEGQVAMPNYIEAGYYDKAKLQESFYPEMLFSFERVEPAIRPSLCNKIVKKDIIEKIIFDVDDSIVFGEDVLISYPAMLLAESILVMKEGFYHYRQNFASVTNVYDEKLLDKFLLLHDEIKAQFEKIGFDEKDQLAGYIAQFSLSCIRKELLQNPQPLKERVRLVKKYLNNEKVANAIKLACKKIPSRKTNAKLILAKNGHVFALYLLFLMKEAVLRSKNAKIIDIVKIKRRYYQIKATVLISLFKLLPVFMKKDYWVLFERGTDARDNAYFFYKFLKEKHPEKKLYYVIDKKSADFDKVKENCVSFGSLKNYWVLARAEKIISSHYYFGAPYMNKKVFDFCKLYERFCWLRHGIVTTYLGDSYLYETAKMRMLVCGAKPEWEYIKAVYGFPEEVAKYTGLARYDNLHDITETNTILLMPTWRKYIKSKDSFMLSAYFKNWQAVLNDAKLIRLLEENDLKLVFYPHYEIQKYIDMFEIKSDRIVPAHFADYDVQTLLKEAKMLVTDYSSVFLDVAYMGKPVVHFQFDKDEFFEKHYRKGYFSFEEMGFGKVCEDCGAVVEKIEHYITNSFNMEDIYKERTDKFFVLKDKHNCERIFDAIMNC